MMKKSLLLVNLLAFTACRSTVDPEENPPPGTQIGSEDAVPEEDSGDLSNDNNVEDDSNLEDTGINNNVEDTGTNDTETNNPSYSIEDKWLWAYSENREDVNTMYEYSNGIRYTYYCNTIECDADYWNSLDRSDAIPGIHSYTWNEETQILTDEHGNSFEVTFECDGGKLFMNGEFSHLWRLSSNCE